VPYGTSDWTYEKLAHMCKDFPSIEFDKDVCDICQFAKQKRLPCTLSTSKASHNCELLHLDIWGPYYVNSIHNHRYFLTIVDDHSRYTGVILMRGKYEARSHVQNLITI
jgi:hypothetical protein